MLKIRLTRVGKKHQPRYRMVVAEHTAPIKGKFVSRLGSYNPESKEFTANKEEIQKWLDRGAKPSNVVAKLLKKLGLNHPSIVIKEFHKKSKKKDNNKEEDKNKGKKDEESK